MRYFVLLALSLMFPAALADNVYQEPQDFVHEVFSGTEPDARVLWITSALRPAVRDIIGHEPQALRVRYWTRDNRTAWILEETGKERPITVGVVVNRNKIERIKVLIYRESRGMEVHHPFFTDQFKGAALASDQQLDHAIDGISGATLSVRALTKVARLALYLNQYAEMNGATP